MFCHEQAPARRVAVGWERPLHVRQTRVTLQHENAAKVAPLEPPRSPLRKTEFGQSIGARDIAESVEAIDPTSTLTRCAWSRATRSAGHRTCTETRPARRAVALRQELEVIPEEGRRRQ